MGSSPGRRKAGITTRTMPNQNRRLPGADLFNSRRHCIANPLIGNPGLWHVRRKAGWIVTWQAQRDNTPIASESQGKVQPGVLATHNPMDENNGSLSISVLAIIEDLVPYLKSRHQEPLCKNSHLAVKFSPLRWVCIPVQSLALAFAHMIRDFAALRIRSD